jgi:hypothetical protein
VDELAKARVSVNDAPGGKQVWQVAVLVVRPIADQRTGWPRGRSAYRQEDGVKAEVRRRLRQAVVDSGGVTDLEAGVGFYHSRNQFGDTMSSGIVRTLFEPWATECCFCRIFDRVPECIPSKTEFIRGCARNQQN